MSFKSDRAEKSEKIATERMPAILALLWEGKVKEADDLIVHAYHDGARAHDILKQYDMQRGVQWPS